MNKQRMAIYSMRRQVLEGNGVDEIVREMMSDVVSQILDTYCDEKVKRQDWNIEGLQVALGQQFGINLELAPTMTADQITSAVSASVKDAFETQKGQLAGYFPQVQKMILLQAIDQRWKEHLQRIDQLREWINLRAYAQKDPLIEYKKEAFTMFQEMNHLVKTETLEKLFKIQLVAQPSSDQPPQNTEYADEDNEEVEEQLEALRPKQRTRLSYSGGDEPGTGGGGGGGDSKMSRADRRRLEREKKRR
jgi:preprotein translocase subunit SecA